MATLVRTSTSTTVFLEGLNGCAEIRRERKRNLPRPPRGAVERRSFPRISSHHRLRRLFPSAERRRIHGHRRPARRSRQTGARSRPDHLTADRLSRQNASGHAQTRTHIEKTERYAAV